jgi:hypothetical protein
MDYICNTLHQIGKKDYKNEAILKQTTELGSHVVNETVHLAGEMIEIGSPHCRQSLAAHTVILSPQRKVC